VVVVFVLVVVSVVVVVIVGVVGGVISWVACFGGGSTKNLELNIAVHIASLVCADVEDTFPF